MSRTELARFQVLRPLGTGGMGVVVEARDHRDGGVVALKTLRHYDADTLLRLKREFRELQGLTHRNLVRLEELLESDGEWQLVMERVDGVELLRGLLRDGAAEPSIDALAETAVSAEREPQATRAPSDAEAAPARTVFPCDERKLRDAFAQLAEGVSALHAAGKLHCDLKPGNVLLERGGRVVILDFGLLRDANPRASRTGGTAGTPLYMAPEQIEGRPLGTATDWYAVGVMLFEALTGAPPQVGSLSQVFASRLLEDAPAPSSRAVGVPADLEALCVALLQRDPAARPSGAEVRRALGASAPPEQREREPPFVGREREQEALRAAFQRSREGRGVTVHVRGASGLGKSTLVSRVLRGLDARVLAGRCYEREAVPFKALDSLVDTLSGALRAMPAQACAALMPRDAGLLAQLFPVLARVDVIASAPRRNTAGGDAEALRSRASAALTELLARLADARPLVLWIDDAQWGDADSARLLLEMLSAPEPPAMLLVLSYRAEDAARSPCLRKLLGTEGRVQPPPFEVLEVAPLAPAECDALAAEVLGERATQSLRELVVRETGGSPLFAAELARELAADGAASTSLATLLRERVGRASQGARGLVEVLSVARGPLAQRVALAAAGLAGDSAREALSEARAGRLLRTAGAEPEDLAETAHDRIRESVLEGLEPSRVKALHGRIAEALEREREVDPEMLAVHLRAVGHEARAATLLLQAAERAERAGAFDHAARLYRAALEGGALEEKRRQEARVAYAKALASVGVGIEASEAFVEAARHASAEEALGLRIEGATQLLRFGRVDDAMRALRAVANSVGITLTESEYLEVGRLSLLVARMAVRGLSLQPRRPGVPSPLELTQLNVYRALTFLSMMDPLFVLGIGVRMADLALRVGEGPRARMGLVLARAVLHTLRMDRRVLEPLSRAIERLPMDPSEPNLPYLIPYDDAVDALFDKEDFSRAKQLLSRARELAVEIPGGHYEVLSVDFFLCWCDFLLGDLGHLRGFIEPRYRAAIARNDLVAAVSLAPLTAVAALANGDLPGARRALAPTAEWTQQGFHIQHFHSLLSEGRLARLEGDRRRLLAFEARWPELARSNLFHVPVMRYLALPERALNALTLARLGHERPAMLRIVSDVQRALRAHGRPGASVAVLVLDASVALLAGDARSAQRHLEAAEALSLEAGTGSFRELYRRARGLLLGGDAGRALVADAERALRAAGVGDPRTWSKLFLPGFDR